MEVKMMLPQPFRLISHVEAKQLDNIQYYFVPLYLLWLNLLKIKCKNIIGINSILHGVLSGNIWSSNPPRRSAISTVIDYEKNYHYFHISYFCFVLGQLRANILLLNAHQKHAGPVNINSHMGPICMPASLSICEIFTYMYLFGCIMPSNRLLTALHAASTHVLCNWPGHKNI